MATADSNDSGAHENDGQDGAEPESQIRSAGAFSVSHALDMIRRRREEEQKVKEEEEKELAEVRREKARDKRRRRRENQKERRRNRAEAGEDKVPSVGEGQIEQSVSSEINNVANQADHEQNEGSSPAIKRPIEAVEGSGSGQPVAPTLSLVARCSSSPIAAASPSLPKGASSVRLAGNPSARTPVGTAMPHRSSRLTKFV